MKKQLNIFIPQWQDSGFTDELYKGANALKEYIERKKISFTDIPISTASYLVIENNIVGYKTIVEQLDKIAEILNNKNPDKIFSIGGGCGIEIPIVSYLSGKYNNINVIWFDAHGDLNTPESSPSKYFHGMPLRFLLDEIKGNNISEKFRKISTEDVLLIGVRDLDPSEKLFIEKSKINVIRVEDKESQKLNIQKYLNTTSENVYLHIDLDVLDPEVYKNVKCPTKGGFKIDELIYLINEIKSVKNVVGMSILENTELDKTKIKIIDGIVDIWINL